MLYSIVFLCILSVYVCILQLKAQMASLLKGHTHLQGEFWVFFDELRPPLARPGQFEDAHLPEEGGGTFDGVEAVGAGSGGGANDGFEEVTLPELEDEEDGQKIPPMVVRRRRRKMVSCSSYNKVSENLLVYYQRPCSSVVVAL